MTTSKILIATDLPYWRNSTGSHRRISAQVKALTDEGFVVQTFYLGSLTREDFTLVADDQLDVDSHQSNVAPSGILAKTKWWLQAVANSIVGPEPDAPAAHATTELTLEDFRWPWALPRFADSVQRFNPNSIIIQYVKLAWLLDAMDARQRSNIQCLIDTHDVQYQRAAQFNRRGHPHWLVIDRETEAATLAKFDILIAIQPDEAAVFRTMVPDREIIVCGHPLSMPGQSHQRCLPTRTLEDPIRAGYLASPNAANFDAIKEFLLSAWIPAIDSGDAKNLRLVIGGGVGDQISNDANLQEKINSNPLVATSLTTIGPVQELYDFYDQIDVVVNPVGFGAGLKIKNCEAIAFGKPLLTTPHGSAGIAEPLLKATVISDDLVELVRQMVTWKLQPAEFAKVVQQADDCRQLAHSESSVYNDLFSVLGSGR